MDSEYPYVMEINLQYNWRQWDQTRGVYAGYNIIQPAPDHVVCSDTKCSALWGFECNFA